MDGERMTAEELLQTGLQLIREAANVVTRGCDHLDAHDVKECDHMQDLNYIIIHRRNGEQFNYIPHYCHVCGVKLPAIGESSQ